MQANSAQELFDQHHLAAEKLTVMSLGALAAIVAMLWNDAGRAGLLTWAGLMAVAAPVPTIIKKVRPSADLWFRFLVPLEIVLGSIWGAVAVLAMPPQADTQAILAAVLAGALLGTPFALSQTMRAFLAFTGSLAVVAIVGFVLNGQGDARKVAVVLAFCWLQGLLLAKAQQGLRSDLSNTVRDNAHLIDTLEDTYAQVLVSNAELAETAAAADRLARIDALTKIPNRLVFDTVLADGIESLKDQSISRLNLAFLDLDKFKSVNDTFGHKTGDQVLRAVATRLSAVATPEETVARIGGDELVMISPGSDPHEVASRLAELFERPFSIGNRPMDLRASVGVASTTTPMPPDGLIRRADQAQYEAKRAGGGSFVTLVEAQGASRVRQPQNQQSR